jgi:hypothetical protein
MKYSEYMYRQFFYTRTILFEMNGKMDQFVCVRARVESHDYKSIILQRKKTVLRPWTLLGVHDSFLDSKTV